MRRAVTAIQDSLGYLLADFIGDDDGTPPSLPAGLPESVAAIAEEAVDLLTDYQSAGYARLYVERLSRFVGRTDVDAAMLAEIARLMAMRMSYQDPIRIAHLKLAAFERGAPPSTEVDRFRWDELVGALPVIAADPLLTVLGWLGWLHKRVAIPYSSKSRLGVRRLRLEAALRRWRLFSERYQEERLWVERWLHMISRALVKQPAAAPAVVETATMVQGFGDVYRRGLADWHAIINGLAKPTFDGTLPLSDLAAAIAEARAAATPDIRQAALKRTIAAIRARALAEAANANAAVE